MKINIETIPHGDQRYPTVGDYWDDSDGVVQVRVSEQRVDVLRRRRETWSGLGALAGVAVGISLAQLHWLRTAISPIAGSGLPVRKYRSASI